MITENHRKESLSISYVQAIAGKAGLLIRINDANFDYGIDGRFSKVFVELNENQKNEITEIGYPLCFQLKASSNYVFKDEFITFTITTKAYNKFVTLNNNRSLRQILIAFCLPEDEKSWLNVSEDRLILNRACYWYDITDKERKPTDSKITLHIPRKNLLTAEELSNLVEKLQIGEF
ncbi:unnamed protein product [Leptospira phage LE1]|uniref:DUF4365 domain-containing protein n=1 Tax=Leptospira phage LE1 TaxID=137511 RepID=Q6NE05_9CAUD|nr:hypothetical protein HWD53_gp38 [Leptospira phage LE1]CAE14720.1 unnamed protein product [Leptospira phage LE1]